jgi:hypothetical protein
MKTALPFPEEGIYLNMPETEYHSIPAFSKSLVKAFKISDIDAWTQLYGEDQGINEAFDYGSALHALLLEGKDAFGSRYCKAFDKRDHPGALDTVDDLKSYLDSNSQTYPKSASKPSLIHIARTLNPDAQILADLQDAHRASSADKTEISATAYDEIVSRDWVRQLSFLADMQASEVSFFWVDKHFHIPCKARLDAIAFRKTMTGMEARVGDIKTFTNVRQKPIRDCVAYESGVRGYHIDAVFYTRALKVTPRIFHDSTDANWPEFSDTAFELLFVEKGKAFPNVVPRELVVRNIDGSLTELGQSAMGAIQDAANRYRDLHSEHGDKPWNRAIEFDYITEAEIPMFLL